MRAPWPGVNSPPCSSVPKYRGCGSPITVALVCRWRRTAAAPARRRPAPRADRPRRGRHRRAGRQPGHRGGHPRRRPPAASTSVDSRTRSPSPTGLDDLRQGLEELRGARIMSADSGEQIAARLLAAATNLCADTAVVVVGRVTIALLGTRTTRDHARRDRGANQTEVGLGLNGPRPGLCPHTRRRSRD